MVTGGFRPGVEVALSSVELASKERSNSVSQIGSGFRTPPTRKVIYLYDFEVRLLLTNMGDGFISVHNDDPWFNPVH